MEIIISNKYHFSQELERIRTIMLEEVANKKKNHRWPMEQELIMYFRVMHLIDATNNQYKVENLNNLILQEEM